MARKILVSSAFVSLTLWLGYGARRDDFWPFMAAYAAFFALYWAVVFRKKSLLPAADCRWLIGLGIVLRALLLFSLPNLSDDFWRFLWDGRLAAAGVHPFAHLPTYFVENQCLPSTIEPSLFEKLNSPRYFTVYPPVCQAVFWLAAQLAPASDWGSVFILKIFLLACEIGIIWTVDDRSPSTVNRPASTVPAGYALNPLAILEIVGNCHFEGAMLFALVLGLRFLAQKKMGRAAIAWAFAVAAKLLPLLFFPLIIRNLGWRGAAIFAAASLILWLPLLDLDVLRNMAASLDLYFQKFEFNASIYYLLREVGIWWKGYSIGFQIAPALALLTAGAVCYMALKRWPLADAMLWASTIYLFLSAAVHPWYAAVPLVLAAPTRWRFPVVWSGAAMLSYAHYADGGFRENYPLIALEYAFVWGCLAWEMRTFAREKRLAE